MTSSRKVRLDWSGEGLVFRGGAEGGPQVTVDSGATAGPSPTEMLLLSLAGCMAVDVVMILEKSRVPLETLSVEASGRRAESPPRRFESIELVYRLRGPEPRHERQVQRAVDLSREKYCSVLHTLDPSIDLDVRVEEEVSAK